MKTTFCVLGVVALLFFSASVRCVAQTNVSGIVVDTNGNPIKGVACLRAGTPSLTPGNRIIYSGGPQPTFTDNEGKFSIPLWTPLVDLQFDGGDHAPAFLYRVSPSDSPLRVVMTEGKVLTGRIVDKQQMPIANAVIELRMPQEDRWYQRREVTNLHGEFEFWISEPPEQFHWMLYYAGKQFYVDYNKVTPETSVTLTVDVRMTFADKLVGAGNASQPISTETNQTSPAVSPRH
jgi:hypothetical protein